MFFNVPIREWPHENVNTIFMILKFQSAYEFNVQDVFFSTNEESTVNHTI